MSALSDHDDGCDYQHDSGEPCNKRGYHEREYAQQLTPDDASRLQSLLDDTENGPLEWVPIGREELRELLRVYRGQLAMRASEKQARD